MTDMKRVTKRDEEHHAALVAKELQMAELSGRQIKQIESLQEKLAMQGDKLEASRLFLESIAHLVTDKVDSMPDSKVVTQAEHTKRWQTKCAEMWGVINYDNEPAQSDVDTFMAKKKAEWEKGVLEEVANYADEAHFRTLSSSDIRRIAKERGEVRDE